MFFLCSPVSCSRRRYNYWLYFLLLLPRSNLLDVDIRFVTERKLMLVFTIQNSVLKESWIQISPHNSPTKALKEHFKLRLRPRSSIFPASRAEKLQHIIPLPLPWIHLCRTPNLLRLKIPWNPQIPAVHQSRDDVFRKLFQFHTRKSAKNSNFSPNKIILLN